MKKPVIFDFTKMSDKQVSYEMRHNLLQQRYSQVLADARVLSRSAQMSYDRLVMGNVVNFNDYRNEDEA